ncbi:MAG: tRNA dihydrouridine synthase DusB [Deltaproteobacteria bacterium]|nr:tRNA dihydrouridine synthase DusB [Deltaproteobacteria bacterium]
MDARGPLRIGPLAVSPRLLLAPMSGVTDSAFRRIVRRASGSAVGLMFTEFVSVEALTRDDEKSLRMVRRRAEERPVAVQIFGADADRMVRAAALVERSGADVLDVNCGCPVPKVVKRGGGCELMRQPERLYGILTAIRREVSIPVTLKMRAGWDEETRNAAEIAAVAEAAGLAMVTVHGRTRVQLYHGEADWGVIAGIRRRVSIPVAGSGDVATAADALAREREFAPDAVMIGRAALANPWIFRQVEELRAGEAPVRPSLDDRIDMMRTYAAYLDEDYAPAVVAARLRQFAGRVTKGLHGGAPLRAAINEARTEQAILDLLCRFAEASSGEPVAAAAGDGAAWA